MAEDDDFSKAFEGFGEDPAPVEPPKAPADDSQPPKKDEEENADGNKNDPAGDKPADTPQPDDKKPDAGDDDGEGDGDKKPDEEPDENKEPEAPKVLTREDLESVVKNLREEERNSGKVLETTTQEVIEKFYPDGLSNVLVDEQTGKELRTPQDVVDAADAAGSQMSVDKAAQWLMNEQYKLDKAIEKIKDDARTIAETTVSFKRDAIAAVEKYEPLFKAYPKLQQKVFDKLMKQVKADEKKGVILSAPDVMEHYDDYLEPYQQAFEFAQNKPATAPAPEPEQPKPSADDRLDESGDGGPSSKVDDPNDFAQQVTKELARG